MNMDHNDNKAVMNFFFIVLIRICLSIYRWTGFSVDLLSPARCMSHTLSYHRRLIHFDE